MSNEQEKPAGPATSAAAPQGHSALLGRFLWAMLGPVILMMVLVAISKTPAWVGVWEGVYTLLIGTMIYGRYLEQRSGHGTTLYGEPSSWIDFRTYAVKLVIVASCLWLMAKLGGQRLAV